MSTTHSTSLVIAHRGTLSRVYREGGSWAGIARTLEAEIRAGTPPVGGKLRSVESLAQRFSVGRGTVQTALSWLQDHGMIRISHGLPTIVVAAEPTGETRTVAEVLNDHGEMLRSMEAAIADLRARVERIEREEGL